MNPVTRRLLDRVDDPDLAELALAWDALEELIVSVSRAGVCSKQDESLFEQRRRNAARACRRWALRLEPHWRATTIDGASVSDDPFTSILILPAVAAALNRRDLLRTLPAAREALNALLLEEAVDEAGL